MCLSKLFRKHDHDFDPDDYEEPKSTLKKIETFERITITESGMRFHVEYEVLNKGDKAEVSLYDIRFGHGDEEDKRILRERGEIEMSSFMDTLKKCSVASWDHFDGPHPKNIKDGTMFRLVAIVNDGYRMYAHGSQNFPRHYHEFHDVLRQALHKIDISE